MRSWAVMAGVVGGVVVSLLLKYPLYDYLPGTLIPSWERAELWLAWVCVVLAALVLIVTGIAGGRLSSFEENRSHWGGAAAGAIAGLIAYGWVISPATGVYGNREILTYGFTQVPDDVSLTWLVLYGVTGTLWWGASMFWLSIVVGAALGALGGWVSIPLPDPRQEWYFYFAWINPVMLILSLLNYIVIFAVYDLLVDTITRSFVQAHFQPLHPAWLSILLLKMAGYGWYLFWQIRTWVDLRAAQKQSGEQHLTWVFLSILALLLPLFQLFLVYGLVFSSAEVFIATFLSLTLGFLTFRESFWQKRSLPMPAPRFSKLDLMFMVRGAALLAIFVTLTFLTGSLSIPLNLAMITITAIAPLMGEGGFKGYHAMLDPVYALPQGFITGIFLVTAAYLALTVWTFSNTYNFFNMYGFRFKRKPEPDDSPDVPVAPV